MPFLFRGMTQEDISALGMFQCFFRSDGRSSVGITPEGMETTMITHELTMNNLDARPTPSLEKDAAPLNSAIAQEHARWSVIRMKLVSGSEFCFNPLR
jgi:hypothetical protein